MASNAHKMRHRARCRTNDVAYADRYLKRYGKDMEADDLLQTTGLITKEMDLRVSTSAATEAMGRWAPKIVPGDMDRLTNIVLAMRSGGRRYDASGKLIEGRPPSTARPRGEMQVLDGTNPRPRLRRGNRRPTTAETRPRARRVLAAMVREITTATCPKALAAVQLGAGQPGQGR